MPSDPLVMYTLQERWADDISFSLALAAKLEGEGQYNVAKLLRAAADAMARRAAYRRDLPSDKAALSDEIERAIVVLSGQGISSELIAALKRGSAAMAERRLPLIDETPHPYVCRTCGHTVLGEPAGKCPTCGAWPATFKRFLSVYWLDALEPFAALERLRQTPSNVAALLKGLSEEDLTRQPTDGGWSIRQVVSHLRDAQGVLSARLKPMLKQENPSLESLVSTPSSREEDRKEITYNDTKELLPQCH